MAKSVYKPRKHKWQCLDRFGQRSDAYIDLIKSYVSLCVRTQLRGRNVHSIPVLLTGRCSGAGGTTGRRPGAARAQLRAPAHVPGGARGHVRHEEQASHSLLPRSSCTPGQ